MNPLPALDAVRCFVLAARLLNFRAASRAVGLTPAALGKRIQQLEDQAGAPLFHRTTRRVELTEAGLALLPHAQRLLEAAEDCLRASRGELGPPPMQLTLGTRHELGLSWLVPLLPRLREAAPSVTFHLYFGAGQDLENRVRTQEIDAAVSSRQLRDPLLHGERLHVERYTFVGSPALLARRPFDSAEDAADHDLIDAHTDLPLFHYWLDAQPDLTPPRFARVILMGTIAAIRALVLAGEGLAVLPSYLVADDLARGALAQVLPETGTREDHFRLLFRHDDPRRHLFLSLAEVMRAAPLC